jgi:hypothetical protein
MNNEQRIILKEDVANWCGLQLQGSTKEELKDSLESIYESLSNELSDKRYRFAAIINSLSDD